MIQPADLSPLYLLFARESSESTATSYMSYCFSAREPTPKDILCSMSKLPEDCPQLIPVRSLS